MRPLSDDNGQRAVVLAGGVRPSGKRSWMRGRTYKLSDGQLAAAERARTVRAMQADLPAIDTDPSWSVTVLPDGEAEGAATMATLGRRLPKARATAVSGHARELTAPKPQSRGDVIRAREAQRLADLGLD